MMSHPSIHLTMVQGGSRELQTALVNEEIDLGVLSFPKIESNIVIEPFQQHFVGYQASLVVPKGHPQASRDSVTFEDLKGWNVSALYLNTLCLESYYTNAQDILVLNRILFM